MSTCICALLAGLLGPATLGEYVRSAESVFATETETRGGGRQEAGTIPA